jgi:hypothetical protein
MPLRCRRSFLSPHFSVRPDGTFDSRSVSLPTRMCLGPSEKRLRTALDVFDAETTFADRVHVGWDAATSY